MANEKAPTKVTFGLIAQWLFGLLFLLIGIVSIFTSPLPGICALLISALLLPPFEHFFERRFNFSMSSGAKAALIVVLLVLFYKAPGGPEDEAQSTQPTPDAMPEVSQTPTTTVKPGVTQKPAAPAPTPIKTPAPTPTRTPTPPPASPTYHTIFTFSGNGTKKSEPFTTTGSRFKIKYTCNGGYCGAYLYHTNGQLEGLIMNSTGPVDDETIFYGAGEYYIDANTTGSFSMTVQDYF